ncbi:bifunctional tRNA (5-methylaminomethyl-2-thiouridine)(34)-methyltransferase MnmD/FAD-dependent 5-carboxymethylaminomethyl-2-thiouridine(34) oxidoreductase MnmC [Vibrio methylphosphonaticus]|uniref:bifunctional tRNA (5-methylaminomethyl-2-thiouridine)(34)-methyltransferase MnmD/FAD-dependent 5-carboxymethylaminomethyl-2-thiouridine(34) oxidoreductase MnmC n=1 Tax=Vibrio methylphosphonaticus TaxID=2946866 RepID=UPI00202A08A1|nr:bifunctional tRNA (5-methylaminomethyl-2-thiouridine)(34)-methyltransferase MnmD/FAD-dependent 5-carboxymethylaminomethyl-2-thiouridine(34) oxidoreductase MnmC [Vibrio methylphosphonaticus]MCL9774262.1 bifunctional tRNA (5-methylaminomethyl-2-thiouridine)(34)-methyltransferase MnmD/FAD-dependent 5-carboxymethylaminomethyl-2-thiouridine(34) oxidoreductase MnmC [Vibrio methylphosphonaticus]
MTSITHAQLDWNEAGTPVSDQFDDVYFSNVNGLEETRYVFLEKNRLPQRWHELTNRRFVIAETGFGTGLNFLAAWQQFEQFREQNPAAAMQELHFISFEKYPLTKHDLEKAHQAWPELKKYAEQLQAHYPIAVPECHRIVLANGMITLDLWFGDIKDCMPLVPTPEQGIVDCWFLDGFAPSKNPEMWNQTLFDNMVKLAKQDATCATFTAAGFVRRGLNDAGFDMKKTKGFGTKREMIAGHVSHKQSYSNFDSFYQRATPSSIGRIAVVGGGIASASLITALSRRGISSTLFCKDAQAAEGASGNRQGAVYPLLNGEHKGVSRVFAPSFLYARQFAEQAATYFHYDHGWCGVTQLKWDEKSSVKLDKMLHGQFPAELVHGLSAQETSNTLGLSSPFASVSYPLGGWLCPAQLTQGLIQKAEREGHLTCHFSTIVSAIAPDSNGKWRICSSPTSSSTMTSSTTNTSNSEQVFDVVIIANGHEFTQLEQTQHLHLSAVKGQVSHIPTTQQLTKLNTVLCYDGYLTPCNSNTDTHCIGASYDKDNINNEFDAAAQLDNQDKLKRCLPDTSWVNDVDTSTNQARQGVRSVSRDHLPFVGQVTDYEQLRTLHETSPKAISSVPEHHNLFCMLGLGSRGLSSAPLIGEVLVSQICGDPLPMPVDLLSGIHPSRTWIRRIKKSRPLFG